MKPTCVAQLLLSGVAAALAATTREVWVHGGDSQVDTSLDDANKARAEKPCT